MKIWKISLKLMSLILFAGLLVFTSCKDDDEDEDPPVVILDGLYVKGGATAYSDFNKNAMMAVTRNEVNQTERSTLFELYIPLKSGADGFNIVKVAGSTQTTYGPGAGWGLVANPTNDEPKDVTFQRGGAEETATKFVVDADGMYHVVIDMEVMVAVVCKVQWGVIGAATPDGWGTSTDLTESAFNGESMSWTISDMELRGGDWKFRYSNGWKIELDTVLDIGGGDVGIKVNTNFGGAVDALVPGGDNFVNADPGVYTIELAYALGTGYTATTTKTSDLPMTNWDGVECDAVGTGVSIENTNAIPDPSSWGWGNVLVADNGGVPTGVAGIYTWTWTGIILEADEGFKVRTLNGVAPPSGGANFDAGFSALDIALSSAKVYDNGGNLSVDTKGTYNIVLVIDASNSDAKTIVITE